MRQSYRTSCCISVSHVLYDIEICRKSGNICLISQSKCTFGHVSMAPTSFVVYYLYLYPNVWENKSTYHESTMQTRCLDNVNPPCGTQNIDILINLKDIMTYSFRSLSFTCKNPSQNTRNTLHLKWGVVRGGLRRRAAILDDG